MIEKKDGHQLMSQFSFCSDEWNLVVQKQEKSEGFNFLVRAYSQQCNRCYFNGEHNFYDEELDKISIDFAKMFVESYYDLPQSQISNNVKSSNMKGRHRKDLCGACKQGVCNISWLYFI